MLRADWAWHRQWHAPSQIHVLELPSRPDSRAQALAKLALGYVAISDPEKAANVGKIHPLEVVGPQWDNLAHAEDKPASEGSPNETLLSRSARGSTHAE